MSQSIPMVVTKRFYFDGAWVKPGDIIYVASDAEASNLHYANLAERTDTGTTPEVTPEQALVWAAKRIEQIAVLTKEFLQLKRLI